MKKNIEVELKYPLLNPDKVKKYLNDNAEFVRKEFQKDTYYSPKHRNFIYDFENIYEWLRIRETENVASINYKKWLPIGEKVKTHCIEYESNISDVENIKNIYNALDFIELVCVDKARSIYNFQKTEISIDDVKYLGVFIEIENKEFDGDIAEIRKYLYNVLNIIGTETGEMDQRGYPYNLLINKREI